MSRNVFELFLNRTRQAMSKPFLSIPDGPSYTFGQVDHRSAAFATALAESGAVPGDRIVAQVNKSPDAVALYWACLRGGFVYVPLSSELMVEDIGFCLGDTEPKVFVCNEADANRLKPVVDIVGIDIMHTLSATGTGSLADAAAQLSVDESVVPRNLSDVAALLYTSANTGRAKGVEITHQNLISNSRALHAIWRWRSGDVLLHTLPMDSMYGLFVVLNCAVLNASEVMLLPKYDRMNVLRLLRTATVFAETPDHLYDLMAEPGFSNDHCSSIRLFLSASAHLPHSTFRDFADLTGHGICECYVTTEGGVLASNPPEGERVAGTVGYPLPNVDLRVVDPSGVVLGPSEIGKVQAKGPNIFKGYWRNPEATQVVMDDEEFMDTGDVGFFSPDGRLTLAGRINNLVVSGGRSIYPREIEIILDNVSGVKESAAIGLPHPHLGQAIAVFLVADKRITVELLRAEIERNLQPFKIPKDFVFVPDLPKSSMGVVQRNSLAAKYAELFTIG